MRAATTFAIDWIPEPIRDYLRRRAAEVLGLALLAGVTACYAALITWSAQDPSLNHAVNGPVHNVLGRAGAFTADLLMQLTGLSSAVILAPVAIWGWQLMLYRGLTQPKLRLVLWLLGSVAAAATIAYFPVTDRWPLRTGLGGVLGDYVLRLPHLLAGSSRLFNILAGAVISLTALLSLTACIGYGLTTETDDELEDYVRDNARAKNSAGRNTDLDFEPEDLAGEPGLGLVSLGALFHMLLSVKSAIMRFRNRPRKIKAKMTTAPLRAPWKDLPRLDQEFAMEPDEAPAIVKAGSRREPNFSPSVADTPVKKPAMTRPAVVASDDDDDDDDMSIVDSTAHSRVAAAPVALKQGKRVLQEAQPTLFDRPAYVLPQLAFLADAKKQPATRISEDALEQNARLLEGVLEDFGVKGEIINVRPGPVVTLYELEPAPGVKSSRVIGLADDIARSMSAISARVAVVQGRNAIGIELPNQRRETVYLRELLACEDFEKSRLKLAIALGKTIGGEPVIVDLAKMPHLLVAGTTGSGKSVAINTMILSILYRMKPEECRMIMVDPKMLELSVYDGIPHLLTPVVTDPKKAVVALKWAVREMEERYKKMSKVGVRNIDGFNARLAEAREKGEVIIRTIQTGFNKENGEATYAQEEMNLDALPYIVVIVDEMADLMMVAGKDIEGAIQRLAQMARAAGIHLIMATQRPSVDVITGTIKANFPTRISFQVTSKIDSRTIISEMGAEQLLGQGDMLYMAGGGRISRVHGPFVSDNEVEKIVAHLKTQGQPEYLDAIITEDSEGADAERDAPSPGSMDAEEGGDLYDRAVNIVLRDRKCSTSYIQRRLSVGYNKAASLVERMEKEGVVGAANHAGKREILVGNGVDRAPFEDD
eukprot:gene9432-9512_t